MKKLLPLLALFGLVATACADTWKIDPRHSSVNFSVRNFFVPVEGSFKVQEGSVEFDAANPTSGSISAVISVISVNTQDADRDAHLNRGDFFLTEQFPTATFTSTSWTVAGDNQFTVTGDLKIKDVTKAVTLQVTLLGSGPGQRGRTVSGWQATTKINRKDWGVNFGPSIADEVALTINVQGIKQEGGQ